MTRPPWPQSPDQRIASATRRVEQLERRRYPSDWYEVGNDGGMTTFNGAADNAVTDPVSEPLAYRDSGFADVEVDGVVTVPSLPYLVTTLPDWLPLPVSSKKIIGSNGENGWCNWRLDPNGDLWLTGAGP